MVRRTLPTTDAALLAWSLNFKTRIVATPTDFGLTPALASAYSNLHNAFAAALAGCERMIRTMGATITKNEARTSLRAQARLLLNTVQGSAGVTDSQKVELGLALRGAGSPSPVPEAAPALSVRSVSGWTVSIRLRDSSSINRRARPAGVSGASVFSYAGDTPPADLGAWKFEGNTGRNEIDLVFPTALAPRAKVWITAFWFNGRKQPGAVSLPLSTRLQGGTVSTFAA